MQQQQQQHQQMESQQLHQTVCDVKSLVRNSITNPAREKSNERDSSHAASSSSSFLRKTQENQHKRINDYNNNSKSRDSSLQNTLKLSNQGIKVISGINHYINIQEIDFSYNQIIKIQNIDRLIMITTLDLSHNRIAIIENLSELLNLQSLNLSHNQIKVFPKILTKNHNLRTINLSHNQIENEDTFNFLNKFIHLKSLDLSQNPIQNLENYQQKIMNAISTLTHLDGQHLQAQQQFSINSYFDDKENIKNIHYSSHLPFMNDQEFKKLLKNHDKSSPSLGCNLAQMVSDMQQIQNTNTSQTTQQITANQGSSNTLYLDSSYGCQIGRGSAQSFSREFQSMKRIPFREIKQSDQKSESFSNQYLSNGHQQNQNYNARFDSNIKVNNFLSSQIQDNILIDEHSNTQFTDIIQLSQQHTPRDDLNTIVFNQKREELVNQKLQKSEEMKNQCIGFLEKWNHNVSVFQEQLNLLYLQNQLFKEWIQSTISSDAIRGLDILQNSIFSELIEKIHSCITLTTQVASLMSKWKIMKVEIIKRLEKFLKQPFHPQEITKKAIELLELPKKSQEYEEILAVQRNCEQIILIIHNMKSKLMRESQKEQKSVNLINQIFKNIIDQNNLYIHLKKITESGKLLSSSIFSNFLLFFKYHIKDSTECIASIQGDIDLNESLRDLLFNNDDTQVQKYTLPYENNNNNKSNKRSIHYHTPILQELDAYLHNIIDTQDEFNSSKNWNSSNNKNSSKKRQTTQANTTQQADIMVNSFHHSCSNQKSTEKVIARDRKDNNQCTRCQEANQIMLQQQNRIDELNKEIHAKNVKIQEKDEEMNQLKISNEIQIQELERKHLDLKKEDEEKYYALQHSLISEEDLFHHLNDQLIQQELIIEQNKEINSRIQEYNNYMVRLMSSKSDDSTEFFKIILTQQAKSIEQMMASNKSNSLLYKNLLKVVEDKTLPQMKLIPKNDVSCQTISRKSGQINNYNLIEYQTSPSKEYTSVQDSNSYNTRAKGRQLGNCFPQNYFNESQTGRKNSPAIDFQKEILNRKKSSNSKIQQSQLDLEKIYISPQRDNYSEEDGQKSLYTFSQMNPSSVEKEVIASATFYNPNKQANEEFSLISNNNQTFSHKKSPNSYEKEISFFSKNNNNKQNGFTVLSRSPWRITQDSKKKELSGAEESQITEIEKEDEEDSRKINSRDLQQSSPNRNYKNLINKRQENVQAFQIQLDSKDQINKFGQLQQFGEVEQFNPFGIQVKQKKFQQNQLLQLNKIQQENRIDISPNDDQEKLTKKEKSEKNYFTFNSQLQQKIVSTLQKKGLDSTKAKVTISKNIENYKKQKTSKGQNSENLATGSHSIERTATSNSNQTNTSQYNNSKTPKKRLNIDLNINLSGNLSNFQSKSTTHQNSNSQTKYFSYNCATTKNSQQLYQNQQKQLNERKNFSESSDRFSKENTPYSCRNSNNASKDERSKQINQSVNQQNYIRSNSIQSSQSKSQQLFDLNHYKIQNNQVSKGTAANAHFLTDNRQTSSCLLSVSNSHTNDNCDSLYHKRMIQSNAEAQNNLNLNNSKQQNKSHHNAINTSTNTIHKMHENYFSSQNINNNKITPKHQQQQHNDNEIINSYQLNQIKEKRYPSNLNHENQKSSANILNTNNNINEQFIQKRPSFFEDQTNNHYIYSQQQYKQSNNM